jgi:hypothetical protein
MWIGEHFQTRSRLALSNEDVPAVDAFREAVEEVEKQQQRRPSRSPRFLVLSKEASARALGQSPILRLNRGSEPDRSRARRISGDRNIARTNLFSRSLLP